MSKTIIIVGAGKGISLATAEKFGKEGFAIGLISRNTAKIATDVEGLKSKGINVFTAEADVTNTNVLHAAIAQLRQQLGSINTLLYNAGLVIQKDILDESADSLLDDFRVNVGGALESVKAALSDLKAEQGTILITGGGFAYTPLAAYGKTGIGKAGVRNLALQLHDRLKSDNIYVSLLTVKGSVSPDDPIHSPIILAEKYWQLYTERKDAELLY